MTLEELQVLNPGFTNAILQEAFVTTVNKVALDPHLFPCRVQEGVRLSRFESPALFVTSNSEVAFKRVTDFNNCDLIEQESVVTTLGSLEILDIDEDYYGLSSTVFDALNNDHEDIPEISITGDRIFSENTDDALFLINGFVYPYFVTYGDPKTNEHRYSIAWMVTTYGAANLTVDEVLLYMVVAKAASIIKYNEGDIVSGNAYQNIFLNYIKFYNRNQENSLVSTTYETGALDADQII